MQPHHFVVRYAILKYIRRWANGAWTWFKDAERVHSISRMVWSTQLPPSAASHTILQDMNKQACGYLLQDANKTPVYQPDLGSNTAVYWQLFRALPGKGWVHIGAQSNWRGGPAICASSWYHQAWAQHG